MNFHQCQVNAPCRICGRKRDPGRTHKLVAEIGSEIKSAFRIDVCSDAEGRHLTRICSTCLSVVRKASGVSADRSYVPQTSIVPQEDWPECGGEDCMLCLR